ncbi:somatostatin-like receptor F_48D10.1 [Triplophysa rosa]|uniref:somatostatin-like receptor F_48D10.1 n=1 Tax=Triplophysa rosa TaxID=992332 RepID=UPI002545D76F|nr:somatostatin-like receptor F_48D10.1 [Triplophysa rosa]
MNNYTLYVTKPEASVSVNSTMLQTLETCVLAINFLVGVPTHSYVIWLIVTGRGILSEFFFLNVSVCELGNCLNCLFFVLNMWTSRLFVIECFLKGLVITGRPLFQCLMCVERYLAVVHPVTFLKYKPLRYRVICSAAAWIICLSSCLCCMFIVVLSVLYVFMWFLSMQFLVFLSINLLCCVAVLRALKQSGPGERGRERGEENHMKRRAFHLILITTLNMITTYVPYILSGIFVIMTTRVVYGLWVTGLICYVLAGFVQPVVFLHRAGQFFCLSS